MYTNLYTIWKEKNKRFRPFCLCPPDVICVSRGSKNSLLYVFDSLSNLDCGQWYKFWICQNYPMSAPATQSVDSRARASFVRSLLCPFNLLLNGWTLSPTYCDQRWQSRRSTTIGVLQLTLQNILYSFPVVLQWNTCGDSTFNACHHMVYTGRPSMKV